jgi:hypothetical protein
VDAVTEQTIKDSALGLLGLPVVEHAPASIEVVASFLTTREPDAGMQVSIGRVLAERAREVIAEKAEGLEWTPEAIISAEVDSSDDADCKDVNNNVGNAFTRGERCYRLVLQVATAD